MRSIFAKYICLTGLLLVNAACTVVAHGPRVGVAVRPAVVYAPPVVVEDVYVENNVYRHAPAYGYYERGHGYGRCRAHSVGYERDDRYGRYGH